MEMELNGAKKRDDREKPKIAVAKGEIGYTDTYKCLGDQYNKSGRNMSKIEKKMGKANFIAAEVKRKGSYSRVGEADTSVRLLLLESVVKSTLLFNTETWVNVTKEEMKNIDRGHYLVLRKIFEQKQNTPYYGILMEIGCWPYSYVVLYKRLMYFHHLIHSDERRIARKVVINQMDGKGKGKSWYGQGVKGWLLKLEMPTDQSEVLEVSKSRWKKELKSKIENLVVEELEQHRTSMTKLRFIRGFKEQDYVKKFRMEKVKKIMQMRLNMIELKSNFKGKYGNTLCTACKKENETTEHVINCVEYRKITGHTLQSKQVNEEMNNLEWMEEACEVYQQIEEVRMWLT